MAECSHKTWVKRDHRYKRGLIWFRTGEKKPVGKWEYLCDEALSESQMDRFMVMHRTVCDLN